MRKLVVLLILAAGCAARAGHVAVERPDPLVGELRCAQPRLTLVEALMYEPPAVTDDQPCQLRD